MYFSEKRLCNFAKLKPKDKSEVRKHVQKGSEATPLNEDKKDEMFSVVEVDLEVDDEE